MAWTDNGPVSLPPRGVAYFTAGLMVVLALAGAGLGFRASWRNGDRPALGDAGSTLADDQATPAKPIVDITAVEQQAVAAPAAAAANSAHDQDDQADDDSNDIAAQTAAAQAVQSRATKSATSNIDDILTSRSERPQAPAKPSNDESAPGGKNDVPF
jgi:hypothetical protein